MRTWQVGDYGPGVANLQRLLHTVGCDIDADTNDPTAKANGFSDKTQAAVRLYQFNKRLKVTGVADPGLQKLLQVSEDTNCGADSATSTVSSPSSTISPTPSDSDPTLSNPPAYKVRVISDQQAEAMRYVSWRPECLPISELRDVDVPYRDFNGQTHMGTIVIKATIADEVGEIFNEIYETGYEIHEIKPIEDVVPAGMKVSDPNKAPVLDEISMKADNTSAFDCRFLNGKSDEHAKAVAIDVNTLENPMITPSVNGDVVDPVEGTPFVNTDNHNQAIITHKKSISDKVIAIFKKFGWRWGGDWTNPYDRQHFDKKGTA